MLLLFPETAQHWRAFWWGEEYGECVYKLTVKEVFKPRIIPTGNKLLAPTSLLFLTLPETDVDSPLIWDSVQQGCHYPGETGYTAHDFLEAKKEFI